MRNFLFVIFCEHEKRSNMENMAVVNCLNFEFGRFGRWDSLNHLRNGTVFKSFQKSVRLDEYPDYKYLPRLMNIEL